MRTDMNPLSVEAFHSLPVLGYLQPKEQAVMEMMADGVARTQEQMAIRLGWAINRVTGRVNSLYTKGALQIVGEAKNASGRFASLYRIPQPDQLSLFQ